MALKADLEEIRSKADRAVQILIERRKAAIDIRENADLAVTITPEIKAEWNGRLALLVARVKAVAATLPDAVGDDV